MKICQASINYQQQKIICTSLFVQNHNSNLIASDTNIDSKVVSLNHYLALSGQMHITGMDHMSKTKGIARKIIGGSQILLKNFD